MSDSVNNIPWESKDDFRVKSGGVTVMHKGSDSDFGFISLYKHSTSDFVEIFYGSFLEAVHAYGQEFIANLILGYQSDPAYCVIIISSDDIDNLEDFSSFDEALSYAWDSAKEIFADFSSEKIQDDKVMKTLGRKLGLQEEEIPDRILKEFKNAFPKQVVINTLAVGKGKEKKYLQVELAIPESIKVLGKTIKIQPKLTAKAVKQNIDKGKALLYYRPDNGDWLIKASEQ